MFNLHLVRINLPRGKSLKIIPVGDVHEESPLCDTGRWRNFLRRCRQEDDAYTWYILLGDPNEFASWSDRNILLNRKLHKSAVQELDKNALRNTKNFIRSVSFMRGRCLGVIEGNHKWEFKSRGSSDEIIAKALEAKFLGGLGCVRIVLSQGGRFVNVDVVATHGKAGGQTAGSTVTQVDKLRSIFPGGDIYIMGHDHERGVWPKSTLILQNDGHRGKLVLKQKRQLLCRSGSFLRGYVDGEDSYVSDKLLRPCELGAIKLEVKVKRERIEGEDSTHPDIHASV